MSWANNGREGGRNLSRLSIVASSAESTNGRVDEGVRRSCSVKVGRSVSCAGACTPPWSDFKKSCTSAGEYEEVVALHESELVQ